MSQEKTIQQITTFPIIPVFYNDDKEVCDAITEACYKGGVRVFELTNRGNNALPIFEHLMKSHTTKDDIIFGAGTIMTSQDAEVFIEAGANFIVSPCFVETVADTCYQNKIPYLPGCMTIKEIFLAMQAGCEIIKVFPGEVLGLSFVKAVKSVLPSAKLMVTGGVSATKESVQSWFNAGVSAIGLGSQLIQKDWLQQQQYQLIEEACRVSLNTAISLQQDS